MEAGGFLETRYSAGAQAVLLLCNAQDFHSEPFSSVECDSSKLQSNRKVPKQLMEK